MLEQGVQASPMCFKAVIIANARCGNPSRAEYWMKRLVAAGLTPDVVAFSSLVNACAKGGDLERAEQWLRTMQSEGCPTQRSDVRHSHSRPRQDLRPRCC